MKTKQDSSVIFTSGFAISKNFIVLSSEPVELVDYEFTRIFTMKEGSWGYVDLEEKISSVCVVEGTPRQFYYLGKNGTVYVRSSAGGRTETIKDAGTLENQLGYVLRIREVCGKLYVCGASSQIYRRDAKGWVHFDEGVLDRRDPLEAIALSDIDGTSGKDIYAVGEKGCVWHHDGISWGKLAVPALHNLKAVRCVSSGEVYIVGYEGTLLKGSGETWSNVSNTEIRNHFWDIEVYNGVAYLAALEGLYAFNGREITPVDTGLSPVPDAYRLHASDGVLWSFGARNLCFFDGKKWTYVKHPDNP